MRQKQKSLVIGDNTYIIKKMNALEGAHFAVFATSKLVPLVGGIRSIMGALTGVDDTVDTVDTDAEVILSDALGPIASALGSMKKEDTDTLIQTCMRHASVVLAAGEQPIMDSNGNWGVQDPDIEYNLPLCIQICVEVVRFNLDGFFGEGGLTSLFAPRNTLQ